MAVFIADVGNNMALYRAKLDEIDEQDVNAQVMPPEMLERLTETIKAEGRLEQLPFAVLRGDRFELISGHHRLRAARAANLVEVPVLADTRDLPRSKVVAKQLAHNSIHGESDKQILARLFTEMDSVEDVMESYVTPADFDDIQSLAPSKVTNLSILVEWRQLAVVFLPKVLAKLDKVDDWVKKLPGDTDQVGVVSNEVFDRFRASALAISKVENVRSLGAVMGVMLDIVEKWCEENGIDLEAPVEDPEGAAKLLAEKVAKSGKSAGRPTKGKGSRSYSAPPSAPAVAGSEGNA